MLEFDGVSVRILGQPILHDISWRANAGEHWVILGPNGAGKSTIVALASGMRHPTAGRVTILGKTLGKTDVRELRGLIGVIDASTSRRFSGRLTGLTVVCTGATGTIEPLHERYDETVIGRAHALMSDFDCVALAGRRLAEMSQGERQRVLLARAMMPQPRLLLLDEATTALDFVARETLLAGLERLISLHPDLTTVHVTHHLEDIPPGVGHAVLLTGGSVHAAGPIGEVVTSHRLTEAFGMPVEVHRRGQRWTATAIPAYGPAVHRRRPAGQEPQCLPR